MSGARPSPFSAGVTAVPLFGRDPDMLTRQADAALYWVKRHGRGAVEVFEPERDQLPDNQTDVARNAVQEVIMGRLLTPVFQPIVDLRTGRVLGFEGLIRPDPSGPLSDTGTLFAAAAMAGRTVELDVACIEQVLLAARAIGPDKLLTLNLSPRTLEVRDFDAGWLLQGLYRNGISPGRVIVELTERDEIDDLARLRQTFRHLREYGLRLAADDVGAGNSGLRLLSQVQFDIVKLDLSLVQDGTRRMGARSVLQSLRDLAIDQHAHVVAEGVETAAHLQVLRDLQIGAGQGYLLGRPGASVAATFVDVDQLGEERPVEVPAATPAAVFVPAALVAGAIAREGSSGAEWPRSDRLVAGHDLRAIVLPAARLGTLAGSSPGTA
jgi:EAL domain-containing protein (putative c-di-GMP-specific phosphodiesterase class I)